MILYHRRQLYFTFFTSLSTANPLESKYVNLHWISPDLVLNNGLWPLRVFTFFKMFSLKEQQSQQFTTYNSCDHCVVLTCLTFSNLSTKKLIIHSDIFNGHKYVCLSVHLSNCSSICVVIYSLILSFIWFIECLLFAYEVLKDQAAFCPHMSPL